MPRCLPILTPFLDRFLIGFYFQLGPPEPEKSSPRCSESTIFQKIALRSWHRFLIDFSANMPPFFDQKSTNNLPKIDPKRHHFFDRFLDRFFIDVCSMLEANLAPCWPLFRLKYGGAVVRKGAFCWICLLFRFLGRPGPFLAPSGLDLGGFGPPFWRFRASFPRRNQQRYSTNARSPRYLEFSERPWLDLNSAPIQQNTPRPQDRQGTMIHSK